MKAIAYRSVIDTPSIQNYILSSPSPPSKRDPWMLGSIYADNQRCAVCGGRLRDNGRNAVCCPRHPSQRATELRVFFPPNIRRRFSSYEEAARFLTLLRAKAYEGSYDPRDYLYSSPLALGRVAETFLEHKQRQGVGRSHLSNLRRELGYCIEFFGEGRNIKTILYADIEDLIIVLRDRGLSGKSIHDALATLRQFFRWCLRRRLIASIPEFPEHRFESRYRRTIPPNDQARILQEVRRLTPWDPKIALGIKWLTTYIVLRPGDLLRLREEDIDLEGRRLYLRSPKDRRPKWVPLLEEDIEAVRDLPRGFPSMPFFRHPVSRDGVRAGQPYGPRVFYAWWKRACANLGVEGVDLYGGTRHSTAQALRQAGLTPDEIKRATMHSTSRAFERYLKIEEDELRSMYELAASGKSPGSKKGTPSSANSA